MAGKKRNLLAVLLPLVNRPPYEFRPLFSDTTTFVYKDTAFPDGKVDDWERGTLFWPIQAKRLPTSVGVPAVQFTAMRARVSVFDLVPDGYTDPGVRVYYRRRWVDRDRVREGVVLRDGMLVVIGNKPFQVVVPKEVPA